ncbi:MAG: hypothetical protein WEG56_04325 [Chloroflexota bacterium]
MPTRLFAALDDEWRRVTATTANAAPRRQWEADETLRRFVSLTELIDALRAGGRDPAAANRVLAALATRAADDDLACRTMLQALLPGLTNVAKRIGHGRIDEELEAEVLTEAVARIRTYPIGRRPNAIAANVTLDVFGTIIRRRRTSPTIIPDDPVGADGDLDPSVEVCDLVRDALDVGALGRRDATLLLSIAVGHDTIASRAAREGTTYGAMNERWRRARNRLRVAVAA